VKQVFSTMIHSQIVPHL